MPMPRYSTHSRHILIKPCRILLCKVHRRLHLPPVREIISTIRISHTSIATRSSAPNRHLHHLPTMPAATSITARARVNATVSGLGCASGQGCITSMHAVNCCKDTTLASTISLCLGAEHVCQPRPADDDDAYNTTRSRPHQKASAECTPTYQLLMKKKFM